MFAHQRLHTGPLAAHQATQNGLVLRLSVRKDRILFLSRVSVICIVKKRARA